MIKDFLNNVLLKAQKDKKNIKEDLETVLDNKSNNIDGISKQERIMPVSYTHLTLPTMFEV